MSYLTEDQVRDKARTITGIENISTEHLESGFGQTTTFKKLGFDDNNDEIKNISDYLKKEFNISNIANQKPDGWYLPKDRNKPAIVFELKSGDKDIYNDKEVIKQIKKYMVVIATEYKKVIGIIYNGQNNKIFKYSKGNIFEHKDINELQSKEYYLNHIYESKPVDKRLIYDYTKKINEILYRYIQIDHLVERMIFTASFLVAKQNGVKFHINEKMKNIDSWKQLVVEALENRIEEDNSKQDNLKQAKTKTLLDVFKNINPTINESTKKNLTKYLKEFINSLSEISEQLNSPEWSGEDVLSIFFNEFSRYKSSVNKGQVFTPDHITQLMYEIADCSYKDNILDATCGSGAFLTKAMSLMINEVGGWHTKEAEDIKTNHLFGIEYDEKIYALACANMLLHKDGKTNLLLADATSSKASDWIKEKKITKVLMNPPYEDDFHCLDIVLNVLNSVEPNADCLFLLPNNKLRKRIKKETQRILKDHSLLKIIKLPPIFDGVAGPGDVCIFWFKTKTPHNNKSIIGFNIKEDGYVVENNKGRQDLNGYWTTQRAELNNKSPSEYWVNAIKLNEDTFYKTKKIIKVSELEYLKDFDFNISSLDFTKVVVDRVMFENPSISQFFNLKGK